MRHILSLAEVLSGRICCHPFGVSILVLARQVHRSARASPVDKRPQGAANSSHTNGVIILPSDPTALLDRLDLLLASHRAGNTDARNEIVSICDELRRQGVVNDSNYKLLMNSM
jgi:hypothetical protein